MIFFHSFNIHCRVASVYQLRGFQPCVQGQGWGMGSNCEWAQGFLLG